MEINISALNQNIEHEVTALICFKNASLISEKEYNRRYGELMRIKKMNSRMLRMKHLSQDSQLKIVTHYSI